MNKKAWLVFGIIVLAVVGGMVFLSLQNRLDISNISDGALQNVLTPEKRNGNIAEHVLGAEQPKVTIIEYGDYQCPGCSTVAPEVKKLTETHQDHVRLIFRNFPIYTLHPNARAAAAAAEAAGLQGKFWDMHSLLYSNRDAWVNASASDRGSIFRGFAEKLGLDLNRYDTDVASDTVAAKINFDVAVGVRQKVSGTPHVAVNGQTVSITDASSVQNAVKDALKKAGIEVDQ